MNNLQNLNLSNILVFDIETVSGYAHFLDQPATMQKLWELKSQQIQRNKPSEEVLSPEASYPEYAGIYAEFGKIVCISVGIFRFHHEKQQWQLFLKSYYGHDERQVLMEFNEMLDKYYFNTKIHIICGHNIREFDVPYLCRRTIINRLPLPQAFDITGKKPWETEHLLDTLNLWKFGDFKSFTSLKLLCGVFNIPTPKDDIDGSEVGKTYWQENNLERIEIYCKKDVVATAQLLLSYRRENLLSEEQIITR